MSNALGFFRLTVEPTVNEFLSDTYDIRRGRLSAIVLNHMADYWCWHVHGDDKNLSKLRENLINKCPEFALIQDIADASKHDKLTRPSKQLSSSEQITRPPGLFQAPFGVGVFAEASNVIFTLDDGTVQLLEPAIRSVLGMWQALVGSGGLPAGSPP